MRPFAPRRRASARIAVVGAALLWGTVGVAGRLAPHGVSPAALSEARLLLGGGALIAALGPARTVRSLATAPRRPLVVAVAAMSLFQWSFFAAVDGAGAGVAAVLTSAAAPLAADALAARRGRGGPRGGWWLASLLAILGAGLATGSRPGSALAILVGLGAGACYGVYADATASLSPPGPACSRSLAGLDGDSRSAPLTSTALALAGGAVALSPAAFRHLAELASPRGLLVAAYLGLPATAVAYALFAGGIARLGAADGLVLVLVQPLAALALDRLLLGRSLGISEAAGIVLAGVSPLFRNLGSPARNGRAGSR